MGKWVWLRSWNKHICSFISSFPLRKLQPHWNAFKLAGPNTYWISLMGTRGWVGHLWSWLGFQEAGLEWGEIERSGIDSHGFLPFLSANLSFLFSFFTLFGLVSIFKVIYLFLTWVSLCTVHMRTAILGFLCYTHGQEVLFPFPGPCLWVLSKSLIGI